MKKLGVDDIVAVIFVLTGCKDIPTRTKPIGSISGTSRATILARKLLCYRFPFPLPTIVAGSVLGIKLIMVRNLSTFVDRADPMAKWIILTYDIARITYNTISLYNTITRGNDKL